MSFPTVRTTATKTGNTNAQQVDIPAGIVAGDLLVVMWARTAGTTAGTIDGDWTGVNTGSGTNQGFRCCYRIADGSEASTTMTFAAYPSGSDPYVTILVVFTVGTWGDIPVAASWVSGAAVTTIDPASLTTGWGAVDTTYMAFAAASSQTALPPAAYPSGYGNNVTVQNSGQNISAAFGRKDATAASDNPGVFDWAGAAAPNSGAVTVAVRGVYDKATTDSGTGADLTDTLDRDFSDTGAAADATTTLDRDFSETGTGTDFLDTLAREYSDSGSVDDQGGAGTSAAVNTTDSAVFSEVAIVSVDPKPGHYRIGKFQTGEALYTIENEIIEYEQINEGGTRVNVVVVDGNEDSWTEYDRDDLIKRDYPLNAYFDLPELKTPGEVRQRAVEELQLAQRRNSPGGQVVWMPWFSKGDNVYWVDEDHNRYETRVEGISVEFDQTLTPFQRASIDTGILVFCPPDVEDDTYLARDLFNRATSDGLGTALIGGEWNIS
jgi:hypothetical protein